MIDEYYEVNIERISPEFPLPIMKSPISNPIRRPGGAANVAHQFRHFNVFPMLVAAVDDLGLEVFSNFRFDVLSLGSISPTGSIPLKRRFLHDGQILVCRWDLETKGYGLSKEFLFKHEQDLVNRLLHGTHEPDVIIFSDYDKGLFQNPINWFSKNKAITIVDPKKGPVEKWRGCTVFKPNATEAKELSGGLTDWKEQCDYFIEAIGCKSVVITQGGSGVVGLDRDPDRKGSPYFEYRPKEKVVVESVIGAGDCFMAFLAMALGHGYEVEESSQIAFEAGKIYVQNKMNRPIVPAELSKSKLVDLRDLASRDFKLVFTNGCFDIMHAGHISTLEFAKSKGDKLVVALNSDDSVRSLNKAPNRPILGLPDRMRMMASLEIVDFVSSYDESTPYEAVCACKADVLVKGADHALHTIVGSDVVKEVYRAPIVDGISTTEILRRAQS